MPRRIILTDDLTGDPEFHAMRLNLGDVLVSDDERPAVKDYVREHGYVQDEQGKWIRKPRERRPDPPPVSGEIVTKS